MKKIFFLLFPLGLLFLSYCASYRLERSLDPDSKEFLSKVRYLITSQERKIFLNIPPSERKNFIEEFWKKRDPDPETEENEFKEQYFQRIEESNRLFRGGGTPGWLQDRGRVYILLGPPDERQAYPTGYSIYDIPTEIWYYGFFPIVFRDPTWSGDYKLEPLGAHHIAEINKAQMNEKPKIEKESVVFDFGLEIERTDENEILFLVKVPYKNIWFVADEKKFKTTLILSLEIFDSSGKKIWEHKENYPLTLAEEELFDLMGKNYILKIPIHLEKGKYSLVINLKNKTDEKQVRKRAEFSV